MGSNNLVTTIMAYIRWKKLPFGHWKAYLVHSYRDEQGRPRQKTLAYLGDQHQLTQDHVAQLQQKHAGLDIAWDKIRPAHPPKRTDISQLSDEELVRNLRTLRREYGIPQRIMHFYLNDAGAPPASKNKDRFRHSEILRKHYQKLELAIHEGREQEMYVDPVSELAPAIRKVLCSD